jgi:chromate transporter
LSPIVQYLWTLFGLSLVAIGGANAVLPELHAVAVEQHHWMTSEQFGQLFAIAQAAPGPNVLVVALVGWKLAGVGGALASIVAMCGPTSILAYIAARAWSRFEHARPRIVLAAVLAPLAVGLVTGSGIVVARTIDSSFDGMALVAVATLVAWKTRTLPLVLLLLGALAGVTGLV